MVDLYRAIRPVIRYLPAQLARELAVRVLEAGLGGLLVDRLGREPDSPILKQRLWGLDFPNPIGLAAGFDKDCRTPDAMQRLGFGFAEVGTVTPRPQKGNPSPWLFSLEEDRAAINRMGFKSDGLDTVVRRLAARRNRSAIIGLNLGKNRETEDAAADYEEGVRRATGLVDYLVVNVSSPNTPGLRDLQRGDTLYSLIRRVLHVRDETGHQVPLLVKISPDLTVAERREVGEVALETGIDGLVISNTTTERPAELVSRHAREVGGLSGRPLFAPSTALLADMYGLTGGRLPLIGVGGIGSAADAYEKIRAGARLVQLYTALVFAGPNLVGQIKRGIVDLLRRDGFASITEAVGAGAEEAHSRGSAEPVGRIDALS